MARPTPSRPFSGQRTLIERLFIATGLVMFWLLVAYLSVLFLAGCDTGPHAGDRCAHPGDYYGHGSTRVHCTDHHVWSK